MKTKATLFFLLLFISLQALSAQAVRIITNDDLTTGQYFWSSDTVYYLNGPVVVEAGGELTIEAGTVIRGIEFQEGTEERAGSSLIIASGARIFANGTSTDPIIFTSEAEDLTTPAEHSLESSRGWQGVYLFGDAPTNLVDSVSRYIIPLGDTLGFGGTNANHDAGTFSYVSIRNTGQISQGSAVNGGLNLMGVGNQTQIDHVEVFNSFYYGFFINGGTVNTSHLVDAYSRTTGFSITNGYKGQGQFWFGVGRSTESGGWPMLHIVGHFFDDSTESSEPDLANITLVGRDFEEEEPNFRGVVFEFNGSGSIRNSVFANLQNNNLNIHDNTFSNNDSYANFLNGDLVIENNVFNREGDASYSWANTATFMNSLLESIGTIEGLAENNIINNDELLIGSCLMSLDERCLDPRPRLNSPILNGGIPITEAGFESVPYQGAFGPDDYWIANWTAVAGDATLQSIHGYVRFNGLADCDENPDAGAARGVVLSFDNGESVRYAVTDSTGFYRSFLPVGNVAVTITSPSPNIWESCNSSTTIAVLEGEQIMQNYYLSTLKECSELYVDLSAPFIRRCFESTYFVTYGNRGSLASENTSIEIVLDSSLNYVSSSEILVAQFGDTLVFAVDDLEPFDQRTFTITVEVSCESELGQEHCTEASIFETAGCTPFVGAQLIVSSYCDGDSVHFNIKNIGDQAPPSPVGFIVIEDEIMLLEGTTNPAPGETEAFTFEALDATFHLVTEAFNVDSGELSPQSISTLSCSDDPNTSLANFPVTDSPAFARDCQTNIGAFDPNDKYGYPLGLTNDHLVPVDPSFTYRIRFQNTGTDTAFSITVLDTLSELLDITTLRMGTASHEMDWTLEGRTLRVSFPNIMLPDSFINEPLSNGFFTYRIAAVPDLEIGSTVYNAAGIYFDFNEPIITNETYHTISRFFAPTTVLNRPNNPTGKVTLAPQPATHSVRISPLNFPANNGLLMLFDPYGRFLSEVSFTTTEIAGAGIDLDVSELATGIYYFRILTPDSRSWSAGKILVKE